MTSEIERLGTNLGSGERKSPAEYRHCEMDQCDGYYEGLSFELRRP